MNIKQAKDYIKNSVGLYLKKDEFGEYLVPVVRQRPIFLLGAPGIGKTAIMEQIAQEMGIALVSYSMTHHTRQSALGLPFITKKQYDGKEVSVSEYTMSEIIASVYETMESSGVKEGILFLDEINCVSETLAPSMLQFLQYKTFGRHQVPEGWVIVTAGNPPEFNKSVREFDVVTMDRLKILEVEADFDTWKSYASERRIHGAVLNFLELKKDCFYVMEMTAKGRGYVTARGWEDLAQMLSLYEGDKLTVDESLIGQYLHSERVVKEFAAYYDLYNKYKRTYRPLEILQGEDIETKAQRAAKAGFDERISLLGMLLDHVENSMRDAMEQADLLSDLQPKLKAMKAVAEKAGEADGDKQAEDLLEQLIATEQKRFDSLRMAGALSDAERKKMKRVLVFLENGKRLAESNKEAGAFAILRENYQEKLGALKALTAEIQEKLHNLFVFAEAAYGDGNEMMILMTELTRNGNSSRFLATFGSEDYKNHSSEMMVSKRQDELISEIKDLGVI